MRKGTTSTIRAVTKLRDALVTGFRSNSQAVEISSIILQRLFFFKLLSTLGLVPTEMLSNEFSRVSQSSIVSLIVHGSGVRSPSDRNQLEIVRVVSRLGLFKPTNSQRAFSEEIDHSFLSDCVHALDALEVDGPNTTAPVDDRILLLGLLYESIKSRGGRKSGGIFYTPFELAERICSHSLDAFLEDWMSTSVLKFIHRILSLRVLDNSCGGGVFLLAMLQRLVEILRSKSGDLDSPARLMKSHGFDCRSTASVAAHILEHCLFGVDLDQGAVNVTEAQLWMVMAALTGSLKCGNSTTNLKTGDSLLPLWPEGIVFDIIVGNPPYLRLSSLDASYRADLKTRYRTAREYNIHALFVEASMKQLAPEGVLGYLVHKNLLTLSSFTQLRKRLLTHHRLKHISDCGSGVFKGVAAETSFIILKKGPQRGTSSVSLSRYDTRVADCFVNTTIPQKEYENLIAPWSHRFLAGIDTKDAELLDSLSHLPRLTDFVSIRRGIETGQNNRFVSVDQRARGNWQPIVRGRDIAAYMAMSRVFLDYDRDLLAKPGRIGLLALPKVLVQQNARNPVASYDDGHNLVLNSATYMADAPRDVLKSICVFINSSLVAWFFRTVMTNNARITVNLLPNNLGSIPVPESFDRQVFGRLCDVLTSLQSSAEQSHDMKDVFRRWKHEIAEAAVLEAYLPNSIGSTGTIRNLCAMLQDSVGLKDVMDIDHESLMVEAAKHTVERWGVSHSAAS